MRISYPTGSRRDSSSIFKQKDRSNALPRPPYSCRLRLSHPPEPLLCPSLQDPTPRPGVNRLPIEEFEDISLFDRDEALARASAAKRASAYIAKTYRDISNDHHWLVAPPRTKATAIVQHRALALSFPLRLQPAGRW